MLLRAQKLTKEEIMALADFELDALRCSRCSYCKFIPYESWRNLDFKEGCPAVTKYKWHAYAAGGKFNMAYSFLNGRIGYTEGI